MERNAEQRTVPKTQSAPREGTAPLPQPFPGAELLGAGAPRDVLARLAAGDPLGLRERCLGRVKQRALLVAQDRLVQRSLARVAHAAPAYAGAPPLGAWLAARIDDAIADLVNEDREEERFGIPPTEPWDPRYAFLGEALGIEPGLARRACIAFNDRPDDVRRAFFAIVVEGVSLRRFVVAGHGAPDAVLERLRAAFLALALRGGDLGDEGGEAAGDG